MPRQRPVRLRLPLQAMDTHGLLEVGIGAYALAGRVESYPIPEPTLSSFVQRPQPQVVAVPRGVLDTIQSRRGSAEMQSAEQLPRDVLCELAGPAGDRRQVHPCGETP